MKAVDSMKDKSSTPQSVNDSIVNAYVKIYENEVRAIVEVDMHVTKFLIERFTLALNSHHGEVRAAIKKLARDIGLNLNE